MILLNIILGIILVGLLKNIVLGVTWSKWDTYSIGFKTNVKKNDDNPKQWIHE